VKEIQFAVTLPEQCQVSLEYAVPTCLSQRVVSVIHSH
jgi:hypothetical protein